MSSHCFFCCWVRELLLLLAWMLAGALAGVAAGIYLPVKLGLPVGVLLLVVGIGHLWLTRASLAGWFGTCARESWFARWHNRHAAQSVAWSDMPVPAPEWSSPQLARKVAAPPAGGFFAGTSGPAPARVLAPPQLPAPPVLLRVPIPPPLRLPERT